MVRAARLPRASLLAAFLLASLAPAAATAEACEAAAEQGEAELLHVSLLQLGRPDLRLRLRPAEAKAPRRGLFGFALQAAGNASAEVAGADAGDLPAVPQECTVPHRSDLARPVREVLAEHPGADGFCYFGFLGSWASMCAVAHQQREYPLFTAAIDYAALVNGSLQTVRYDGGTFYSENHVFLYDDLYCHANRWLQGQGLPHGLMSNYTAWSELAAEECRRLDGRFPEYQMSIADMATRSQDEIQALQDAVDHGTMAPTMLDMQRHAAVKCAMGSLGCDLAYCNRWCLRGDGTIGRTSTECEGEV